MGLSGLSIERNCIGSVKGRWVGRGRVGALRVGGEKLSEGAVISFNSGQASTCRIKVRQRFYSMFLR